MSNVAKIFYTTVMFVLAVELMTIYMVWQNKNFNISNYISNYNLINYVDYALIAIIGILFITYFVSIFREGK